MQMSCQSRNEALWLAGGPVSPCYSYSHARCDSILNCDFIMNILLSVSWWKNCESWSQFDKVKRKSVMAPFGLVVDNCSVFLCHRPRM